MNVEFFVTLMNGIESLVVSLAVLGGGIWAVFKFTALGGKARAQAELQRIQQLARVQAVIEISIDATQITLPDDDSLYVSVVVEIRNNGTNNTRLEFAKDRKPFSVASVAIEQDGEMEFSVTNSCAIPVATALDEESPSILVRATGVERIPFVFRIGKVGLYLLIFSAPVPQDEKKIAEKLGFEFKGNWVGKKFIVVE